MGFGVNRETGAALSGWPHVVQCIAVILSTRIGTRWFRRMFGAEVPRLLGENLTERTVLRFMTAVIVAIELWEPRFRVRRIDTMGSAEQARGGRLGYRIRGEYRPRGHLGDPTPEGGERTLAIGPDGSLTE